jgi:hypothetical protein
MPGTLVTKITSPAEDMCCNKTKLHLPLFAYLLIATTICTGCAGIPHGDFAAHCECESTCDGGAPACSESCDEEMHAGQLMPFQDVWSTAISVSMLPMGVVGNVANFCLPVTALAPPAVPPPGRFHPVPTRPVFRGHSPAF